MKFQDPETIYSRLFALMSATQYLTDGKPNGTFVFAFTSRKIQPPDKISYNRLPAMFFMEGEVIYSPDDAGLSVDQYKSMIAVYFRSDDPDADEIPAIKLNAIRAAVHYQIRHMTLSPDGSTIIPMQTGVRQTLGGACYNATLDGVGPANEGIIIQKGGVVFPVTVLAGI